MAHTHAHEAERVAAWGDGFGSALHAERAPSLLTRTLRQTEIAVTEVRAENPVEAMSDSIPREDAFLVALQLRDYPVHEFWEDGRRTPIASLSAGCTTVYDLKRDPAFLINNPFHSIHVYLPRATLDAIADEASAPPVDELRYDPGQGIEDAVARSLILSLRPALAKPAEANDLFVSAVLVGFATHAALSYGGMVARTRTDRGTLAPWQRHRAEEFLLAHLDGHVSLRELAWTCGLSASHFARAFRKTFGLPPHRWLIRQRIEKAKAMLPNASLSIAEIAVACGFADQSHLTRVFAAHVGTTPARWRRSVQG